MFRSTSDKREYMCVREPIHVHLMYRAVMLPVSVAAFEEAAFDWPFFCGSRCFFSSSSFCFRFCFGFCLDLAVLLSEVLVLPVSQPAGEEFVEPAREVPVLLPGVVILP